MAAQEDAPPPPPPPPPNDLNQLLEDALTDLLLDDNQPSASTNPTRDATSAPEQQLVDERRGAPNIEESLKKITALNSGKDETATRCGKGQKSSRGAEGPGSSAAKQGVVDEDEMNRFFASMTEKLRSELPQMDPREVQAQLSDSVPQIFDLMQNLLSKELLYPALKDLEPKFKEWLERNLATLGKDDRRRYKKQMGKIREIIQVFDDESLEDQERFEKNLELMEQMQSYGAPPEELTVPDGMSKCSIM